MDRFDPGSIKVLARADVQRAIIEEFQRRIINRTQPSLVMQKGHPYNDLWLPRRYKTLYGGRDSGKSWSVAEYLIRRASVDPLRVLCTREYQNSIKDSVHRLLTDQIHRWGYSSQFYITEKSIRSNCGSEFIFKGLHNNVQEIKSTEGIDICWVEEAHYTSEDSWMTLIPTIRKEGSEIITTFNVTDEESPTYVRLVTKADRNEAVIHQVNYDQNPYLSETSKKEIEWLRVNDFHAFEHVYLGLPRKISDAVIFGGRYTIENFSDQLWQQATNKRPFYGADFGFAQDPTAVISSFEYEKKLYIEYESWGIGVEFAGEMLPGDSRGELERHFDLIPRIHNGFPIKCDSSRPETISFLRGKGFNVSAADKWKGSVEDGISHIKGFEKIIIHPRCKHMQQEARLYSFKRDPSGQILPIIIDKHNHCWDAVRYSLDGYIQRRGDLGIWAKLGRQQ